MARSFLSSFGTTLALLSVMFIDSRNIPHSHFFQLNSSGNNTTKFRSSLFCLLFGYADAKYMGISDRLLLSGGNTIRRSKWTP